MAVTAYMYGNCLLHALNKEIDFNSDDIRVALCTSTYTPNQDTHEFFSHITNEVATAGNYTAFGAVLGTPAVGYTAGTNVIKLSGDNVTWGSSTITARYAIVYDYETASAATGPLI